MIIRIAFSRDLLADGDGVVWSSLFFSGNGESSLGFLPPPPSSLYFLTSLGPNFFWNFFFHSFTILVANHQFSLRVSSSADLALGPKDAGLLGKTDMLGLH